MHGAGTTAGHVLPARVSPRSAPPTSHQTRADAVVRRAAGGTGRPARGAIRRLAPAEIYAQLLDEGRHLCSIRTMYRILVEKAEVRNRRRQRLHPPYANPELLATEPNQVWSWDITKLLGPTKWTYYYLYVLLDTFSRYVVGWLIAERESGALAKQLIAESCARQSIEPGALIIHSDRGSAMTSKTLAQTLGTLGVTKSHSRPHVSDDNPISEAQFKTLKYRLDFPARFDPLEHGERSSRDFFNWYNGEHHHVSLGLMTPHDMHHGLAQEKWRRRQLALLNAYAAHPERYPAWSSITRARRRRHHSRPPRSTTSS